MGAAYYTGRGAAYYTGWGWHIIQVDVAYYTGRGAAYFTGQGRHMEIGAAITGGCVIHISGVSARLGHCLRSNLSLLAEDWQGSSE